MRFIKGPNARLDYKPRACIVTNRTDGDFIDFQTVIDRPEPTHVYLSTFILKQVAKEHLGMATREETEELKGVLNTMGEELEAKEETEKTLREQIAKKDARIDALQEILQKLHDDAETQRKSDAPKMRALVGGN